MERLEKFRGSSKDVKINQVGDVREMVMLGKLMDSHGIVWIASEDVEKTSLSYDEDTWKTIVRTLPVTITHNRAETRGMTRAQIRNKISKEPWKKLYAELRSVGIPCFGRIVWHDNEDGGMFVEKFHEDPDELVEEGEKEGCLGCQQVASESDHDKGVCGCLAGLSLCLCNAMKEVRFGF